MNEEHIELYNVAELTPAPGQPGARRLSRFPARLESAYSLPNGKGVSRVSTGCEIRFVPQNDAFRLFLSTPEQAKVHLHQGDFWLSDQEMEPGRVYQLQGERQPLLKNLPAEARKDCLFSGEVMRLVIEQGVVYLHELDTFGFGTRKPTADEAPRTRWLAYGSSITQTDTYGYIHQAAARLRVDVLNKGMSGSCGVEKATVEYLAHACEWDFMTCEWGINMRHTVEPDDFEQRVNTALDILLTRQKPIVLITHFLNDAHVGLCEEPGQTRQGKFNDILRKAYEARKPDHPQLHLIEGTDICQRMNWLVGDLVHPSHQGHSLMGEQLAKRLRPLLGLD